jgi:UDP-3-O-[3-hydroxymyristoyl] glucosamine N-acyltransferase
MRAIHLTVNEICTLVEGISSLDSFLIKNIRSLEHAEERDLAFVFDPEDKAVFAPVSLEKVMNSKAGVIVASRELVPGKNYILVKDPLAALEKLSVFLDTRKEKRVAEIDKTAVVGEFAVIEKEVHVGPNAVILNDAKIGFGATIGAQVFIGKECVIGCYVTIHPGAKILDRCVIGDHSIIHSGAVIGSDGFGYRLMDKGLRKIPHIGNVRIGRHVEIGANCCIDRAEFEETVIGDGAKLDNEVHIAHNVKIGPCTAILAQTGIAGSVTIGAGCMIGGQVAIKDHVTIGNGAKVVSKSAVMRDVKDGEVVCGIPSIPFNDWKRMTVAMSKVAEYAKMSKAIQEYLDKKKGGFFTRVFGR